MEKIISHAVIWVKSDPSDVLPGLINTNLDIEIDASCFAGGAWI